jgi:virginiamycin B lyase
MRLKSTVKGALVGALTEYNLPSPSRWPNGIAAAPDGSVWFGEQAVPGVGRLFGNGTLIEYSWPFAAHPASSSCGYETGIWGIALWNGMVWGTSSDQDAIIGVNPQNGATRVLNLTGVTIFPYTLAVSPDGSLWFTALADNAVLGRVAPDYSVSVLPVSGLGKNIPTQVDFVNSTYSYFVALNAVNNSGGLYSFNPLGAAGAVTPLKLGGSFPLTSPDSVSSHNGTVWVAQHGAASVAMLDTRSMRWTIFPTSTESYTSTTLPYFVAVSDGRLWFNEHYGNRIASIDPVKGTLTEYSESDPPVTNASYIGNDLTIATAPNGLWFTSTTGNYIGLASSAYTPSFSLSILGGRTVSVQAGGQVPLRFSVDGSWNSPLSVGVSDSEAYTSVPKAISMVPSEKVIPPGSGPAQLQMQIGLGSSLKPGQYTLAVTVSDGLVLQSAFVFLNVT